MAKITNNQETRNKQSTIINKQDTKKWFGYWFLKFGYCLVIVSCIIVSFHAEAASLSIISSTQEFGINRQFQVDLLLSAEGQDLNAAEGEIVFPADILELKEIRDGNSVLNFWVEKPEEAQTGLIDFAGIVAGGYRGEKGLIFSMIFEAKEKGEGAVEIKNGKVLLNDGKGTSAELEIFNFQFSIFNEIQNSKFEIQNLGEDRMPPEEFKPEIAQDPVIFDGKWFLVFTTQDKGSGIAYYEVLEKQKFWPWDLFENWKLKIENLVNKGETGWRKAESPYVLSDQSLTSYIYVKAVDKAGNAKISVISPRNPQKWYENTLIWGIIIIAVIGGVIMAFVIWKILVAIKIRSTKHEIRNNIK